MEISFAQLIQLQFLFHAADPNLDFISVKWARFQDRTANLLADLDNFRKTGYSKCPVFEYWNKLTNCVAPTLIIP